MIWWQRGHLTRRDFLVALPLFLMGLGLGLATAWLESDPAHIAAQGPGWNQTFLERCLIAGRALWFYAGKLIWPDLCFIYQRWTIDTGLWWQYAFPAAAMLSLASLGFLRNRLGRGPLTGALYFVGTLFPALGFFNVYYMQFSYVADHWQYLACTGLIVPLVAGLNRLANFTHTRSKFLKPVSACIVVAVLGFLSGRQQRIYKDIDVFWSEILLKNPDAWLAHNNLGMRLKQQGKIEEAAAHYRQAVRAHPAFSDAWNNLGVILKEQDRLAEARDAFQCALDAKPNSAAIHNNLAGVFRSLNQLDLSESHFRAALKLQPNQPITHYNLALTLKLTGPFEEMMAEFREALRLKPDWRLPMRQLAWYLATNPDATDAQIKEALRLATRAAELAQNRAAEILDTLAVAQAAAGDFEQATRTAQQASSLAKTDGNSLLAGQIRQHLDAFQNQRPYKIRWRPQP